MNKLHFVLLITVTLLIEGAIMLQLKRPVSNVSAIETTSAVGVYLDAECKVRADSLDWGSLSPGQTKTLNVYVRNEGVSSVSLDETVMNWDPQIAGQYLEFECDLPDRKVETGEIVKVSQTLFVQPVIRGFESFSFDILFEGREFLRTDLNKDGAVNLFDLIIISSACGSTPGSGAWNPDADLNKDGHIDILDQIILSKNFGKGQV